MIEKHIMHETHHGHREHEDAEVQTIIIESGKTLRTTIALRRCALSCSIRPGIHF